VTDVFFLRGWLRKIRFSRLSWTRCCRTIGVIIVSRVMRANYYVLRWSCCPYCASQSHRGATVDTILHAVLRRTKYKLEFRRQAQIFTRSIVNIDCATSWRFVFELAARVPQTDGQARPALRPTRTAAQPPDGDWSHSISRYVALRWPVVGGVCLRLVQSERTELNWTEISVHFRRFARSELLFI